MDGGRVLRAALWPWRGDLRQATRIAANAGHGFGTALLALAVLTVVLTGTFVGGMCWFLLGLLVRGPAATSYQPLLSPTLFQVDTESAEPRVGKACVSTCLSGCSS